MAAIAAAALFLNSLPLNFSGTRISPDCALTSDPFKGDIRKPLALRAYAPFQWGSVLIFPPYSPLDAIDLASFNVSYAPPILSGEWVPENASILVFRLEDTTVCAQVVIHPAGGHLVQAEDSSGPILAWQEDAA